MFIWESRYSRRPIGKYSSEGMIPLVTWSVGHGVRAYSLGLEQKSDKETAGGPAVTSSLSATYARDCSRVSELRDSDTYPQV